MRFQPEDYFRTATQRLHQANALYRNGKSYALAIYVAGLSVECLLRAFQAKTNNVFDKRHDLLKLLGDSHLLKVNWESLRKSGKSDRQIEAHLATLRRSMQQLAQIWHNGHRFASEEQLEKHLKKTTGQLRIKGDYLKARAHHVIRAAQDIMIAGIWRWSL